jgi:hypothetical protein
MNHLARLPLFRASGKGLSLPLSLLFPVRAASPKPSASLPLQCNRKLTKVDIFSSPAWCCLL